MKKISSIKDLSVMSLKEELSSTASLLLRIFLYLVIFFLFFQTFTSVEADYDRVVYIALTQMLVSSFAPLTFEIFAEIQTGSYLLRTGKPFHYLEIQSIRSFSVFILRFTMMIIAVMIYVFVTSQKPIFNLVQFFMFICSGLIGGLIYTFLGISIGLISYWTGDVKTIFFLNLTTMFCLGGLIVPLESYSETMRIIAFLSPYPWILWCPAHMRSVTLNVQLMHLGIQVFWCGVSFLMTLLIYKRLERSILIKG